LRKKGKEKPEEIILTEKEKKTSKIRFGDKK